MTVKNVWFATNGFEFRDYICNDSHDLTIPCLNISDIAIINYKGVNYCFIIHGISKSKAIRC